MTTPENTYTFYVLKNVQYLEPLSNDYLKKIRKFSGVNMQTTMNLLEKAVSMAPIPTWTKRLELSRDAISNAKSKGHLTPVIAAGIAAELHEDVAHWTTIAAIEGAPDSPAKRALMKRLKTAGSSITSLYFSLAASFHRPRFSAR